MEDQLDISLLPAADIGASRTPSPVLSDTSYSDKTNHSRAVSYNSTISSLQSKEYSHRGSGSGSTDSMASTLSDSGHTQLLTPTTRPSSADPFVLDGLTSALEPIKEQQEASKASTPTPRGRDPSETRRLITPTQPGSGTSTPTVTPYDGGNVTVLGGGVKLGSTSASRASSAHPVDRDRSPSISLASRALSSATTTGSPRKPRTRKRIMPTYLGHLGQPGVGGPIMGAFQYGGMQPMAPPTWSSGVGVGMRPPPAMPPRMVPSRM